MIVTELPLAFANDHRLLIEVPTQSTETHKRLRWS